MDDATIGLGHDPVPSAPSPPSAFHAAPNSSRSSFCSAFHRGGRSGPLVEPDTACTPVLQRLADVHAALPLDGSWPHEHLPADVYRALIHVVPRRAAQLTSPESGRDRQPPYRVQPVASRHLEEPAHLVPCPSRPFHAVYGSRRVHRVRNVGQDVSASHGVVERLVDGDVDVPRRLSRERAPTSATPRPELPVQPVEVTRRESLQRHLTDPGDHPRLDHRAVGVARGLG